MLGISVVVGYLIKKIDQENKLKIYLKSRTQSKLFSKKNKVYYYIVLNLIIIDYKLTRNIFSSGDCTLYNKCLWLVWTVQVFKVSITCSVYGYHTG